MIGGLPANTWRMKFGMARGTVLRSYHHVDMIAVVLKGVLMFFRVQGVALGTAYDHTGQFAGYLLK